MSFIMVCIFPLCHQSSTLHCHHCPTLPKSCSFDKLKESDWYILSSLLPLSFSLFPLPSSLLAPTGALIVMMCYYISGGSNFFRFSLSPLMQLMLKLLHLKSLKQFQCKCHKMLIECQMFQCSSVSIFQCSNAPMFYWSIGP